MEAITSRSLKIMDQDVYTDYGIPLHKMLFLSMDSLALQLMKVMDLQSRLLNETPTPGHSMPQ